MQRIENKTRETKGDQSQILLVSSHPQTINVCQTTLEASGYQLTLAYTRQDALWRIEQCGYPHLLIFDDALQPDANGQGFCATVHQFTDLPIIVLTTDTGPHVSTKYIDTCAEDVIIKPVTRQELRTRVAMVMRSMGQFAFPLGSVVQVDAHLGVDFFSRQLLTDKQIIELTPTETKLLYILMRSAGETVTLTYFFRRMWPNERVDGRRLRQYISRLRRKIDAGPSAHSYIQVDTGKGYRFTTTS